MLIGVMCEVVSGVSQTEREVIAEAFVREKAPPLGWGWVEAPMVHEKPYKSPKRAKSVRLKLF